jgi:NCS1 family nucleobase:cation symporter-1
MQDDGQQHGHHTHHPHHDDMVAPTTGVGMTGIEVRSIDYVPENERHGKISHQGPFWFLGNFQPFTLSIGLLAPVLGLSFGWAALALVLGVLFGTIFMAAHASQGPKLGLPQMIQSRAQFGYRGVIVPLFATLFTFVGFNVVDAVIIKIGLNSIWGWSSVAVAAVITVIAVVLAIYGHDWLHRVFQVLFWCSLPLWTILTIGVLFGQAGPASPAPDLGFTWAGFLAMFTTAAAYNVTYAPYVSDYSRYLPRNTPTGSVMRAVFIGAAASPIWLMPLGAWFGCHFNDYDPLSSIYTRGNAVFGNLGTVLLFFSVLALVATMGLNAYSGMLTVVTGVDSIVPVRFTRSLRIVVILVLGVGWLLICLPLDNVSQALFNTLTIMLYLLAPWTAVNLMDFFYVRHGHYAITDLFTPSGIYRAWGGRGIAAYLIGIAVEIPFMGLPGLYESWGWQKLNYVDISWMLGLVVAGFVYFLLSRRIDVVAEEPAIERSEQVLAETGAAR